MASIVILGHGGFDQVAAGFPGEVLVPPDTTLRFFSDAGQPLLLPAKDGRSDYDKVVNVWDHYREQDKPLPARWVTYNFELAPDDTQEEYDLGQSLDWGATVVAVPPGGGDLRLCTGTADTCPTPALNVQQQQFEAGTGEAVPEDRWNHHCTGILGQYAGNDIIWMACTGFIRATPQLGSFETSPSYGPASSRADWTPTDADWDSINAKNQQTIKDADDGATLPVYAGGLLLVVGDAHDRWVVDYVRRQQDLEYGDLTVTKGGTFSSGRFEITGISAKQSVVEAALQQVSDKKIVFS